MDLDRFARLRVLGWLPSDLSGHLLVTHRGSLTTNILQARISATGFMMHMRGRGGTFSLFALLGSDVFRPAGTASRSMRGARMRHRCLATVLRVPYIGVRFLRATRTPLLR